MINWVHYADEAAVDLARARTTTSGDKATLVYLTSALENIERAIGTIEENRMTDQIELQRDIRGPENDSSSC